METYKRPLKKLGKLLLVSVIAFPISVLLTIILGGNAELALSVPPIGAFIHIDPIHALTNIISLFLLFIPSVNDYSIKKIIVITTIISILYLPLQIMGFECAIGLSGLCSFLASRFFFSREQNKLLWTAIGICLILVDLTQIMNPDRISHGVHLIGYILGYLSIKKNILSLSN